MLKNRLFGAALLFLISSIGASFPAVNLLLEMGYSEVPATVVLTQVNTKESKKVFDMVYRFKLDNTNYVRRQQLGEKSEEEIKALAKKYAKNSPIKVIFDPNDPKSSKLKENRNPVYLFFVIAFPIVLLLASLVLFRKVFAMQKAE